MTGICTRSSRHVGRSFCTRARHRIKIGPSHIGLLFSWTRKELDGWAMETRETCSSSQLQVGLWNFCIFWPNEFATKYQKDPWIGGPEAREQACHKGAKPPWDCEWSSILTRIPNFYSEWWDGCKTSSMHSAWKRISTTNIIVELKVMQAKGKSLRLRDDGKQNYHTWHAKGFCYSECY